MTPYYNDKWVTLYHGDCTEIVPALGMFDLVLTDPPYILDPSPQGKSEFCTEVKRLKTDDYIKLTDGFDVDGIMSGWQKHMVLFNAFCFCSNKQIPDIMNWGMGKGYITTLLIWNKPNVPPFANNVWRGDAEFCVHIRQSGAYFEGDSEQKKKVVTMPRLTGTEHPTEKPLDLVSRYVQIGTKVQDIILDPYAGSGTTGVAAKRLNRRCVLIEMEEKYCEIAARRLSQGVLTVDF